MRSFKVKCVIISWFIVISICSNMYIKLRLCEGGRNADFQGEKVGVTRTSSFVPKRR